MKIPITCFGCHYESIAEFARKMGQSPNIVSDRLFKRRWDIAVAAVVPTGENFRAEYIGIDGKLYYKCPWPSNYDSVSYLRAREVVKHYRPDLLEAYDRENPTEEYRPYPEKS